MRVVADPKAITVSLPVRLLPPTPVATAGDPLTATLAQLIKEWYQATQPSVQSGAFTFDLSAFSSLSRTTRCRWRACAAHASSRT